MKQNVDLTRGDITSSLIKLSIPLALTALIQITYSFVDMFFLGRLGSNAIAGVGIAGFLLWIANAVVLIPKIGTGVFVSQSFGRGEGAETIRILNNGYILTAIVAAIYGIFVLLFRNLYVNFYKLSPSASNYAREYIFIISLGMIFFFINPIFSQSFQSLGNSLTPFKINTIGLVANIVIDPIFIFGWGPIPRMEVRGAAIATVLAQIIVSLIFLIEIFKNNEMISSALTKIDYRPNWIREIIKMGTPAAMMSSLMAVISIILNKFMANFGEAAVAAYSIGSQLESITWNTTEGLQVGIAAMVGQNFGAGKYDRVKDIVKKSFQIVSTIGAISMLVLFAFRFPLMRLFAPTDPATIEMGGLYLAILSVSQIFMATEIGLTGAFNGMGDTKTPARISLSFNILRIPLAMVLMPILGVAGVWSAMAISSIFKGTLNAFLLRKRLRENLS